jgi:hypothetical protein
VQIDQSAFEAISAEPAERATSRRLPRATILLIVGGVLLLFLAFYHLTEWPATWFDEGSHLHVPKTLVTEGVYADRSSEGYRFYGPTVGVGPTVMLPIAGAFRIAGVGLMQARVVMAVYLLLAVAAFFALARQLGSRRYAWTAVALLVATRGVALFEYGRQVLGEVPGLFFLAAGLALWFSSWENPRLGRLVGAGLLIGLSLVTKSQNLLIVAPALVLAWFANIVYYRATPQKVFIVTGGVAAVTVAIWQVYQVLYLGPATASENLSLLRAASAGAAFVFSPDLMRRSLGEILSVKVYFGLLLPLVAYGVLAALPRSRTGMRWGVIVILVVLNLVWYLLASIGWPRYAFLAFSMSALFAAKLIDDLLAMAKWEPRNWARQIYAGNGLQTSQSLVIAAAVGLVVMVTLPLALTARTIVAPPVDNAAVMADWLDANLPETALIETWEPEMGFLTNHRYHYPPNALLNTAVGHIWLGGPSPADDYSFVTSEHPPYILLGAFARWVNIYKDNLESPGYELIHSAGPYELYQLDDNRPNTTTGVQP